MTATVPDGLQVRLLGGFGVAVGGQPVPPAVWRRKRAAAVIKLLALEPSHRLHREQLVEALWPEHEPAAAAGHLRFVLHQARRRLEEAAAQPDTFLARDGEGVTLGPPDRVWVDVDAFEAAVTRAWRVPDPAAADEALALYGGDLLPEDPYEEWVEGRRAALRASYLTLLRRLAELHEGRGELGRAIAALQRLVAAEPTDEAAQAPLIRLLAETGQRAQALAAYDHLVAVLAREVAAEPEPATRALVAAIRDGRFPETVRPLDPAASPEPATPIAPSLPTGTVAFLFTDIEGSTERWERDPEGMAATLARHDALLRQTIAAHRGHVFKTVGDEICAVFTHAGDGLAAAVAAQRALLTEPWGDGPPLRVRMALHAAVAEAHAGDYLGPPLNRVARLLGAAHGGQILLSRAVQELVRDIVPEGFGLRDLGEHHLRDLHHPERIFQVVGSDLPAEFPPLRTPDERLRGLPAPVDELIGREQELAELRQLFATSRLVTLTGPGGIGKTRLALAVARELAADEDAAFVELAPLRDPALVVPTIAQALGVREESGRPLLEAVTTAIGRERRLLALDNLEHLLVAAPVVAELLAACPRLSVLATSRARLRLRGEHEYPVRPLALPEWPVGSQPRRLPGTAAAAPDAQPPATAAELSRYAAVSLFDERARAADPGFVLDDRTAPAVAAICRRLDGLPLAIELAAARIRMLPPQVMLARLDRPEGTRLQVLVGGPRDLAARQQTLRATIEWSHDLLSEDEQVLFRRLAVFAGGFTLETAEFVGTSDEAGDPLGPSCLDLLGALLDGSLIAAATASEAPSRLTMLQTIREYGLERLAASGEEAAVRRAHAACFLTLAEEAEPRLRGAEQAAWLDRLDAEHDNLRAALAWTIEHEEGVLALRLSTALLWFWQTRCAPREGLAWVEEALARGTTAPSAIRARALFGLGRFAIELGDLDRAETAFAESLTLRRQVGDRPGIAQALTGLSFVQVQRDAFPAARALLEEALAIRRELGDQPGLASSLYNLADLVREEGDLVVARDLYRQALALWRELGDSNLTAYLMLNLAVVDRLEGNGEAASRLVEQALALFRDVGNKLGIANALIELGHAARRQADLDRAERLYVEALALFRELESRPGMVEGLEGLAAGAAARGDRRRAARLLGAATAERAALRLPVVPRADAPTLAARVSAARQAADDWVAGAALVLEQAVAEALTPPAPPPAGDDSPPLVPSSAGAERIR